MNIREKFVSRLQQVDRQGNPERQGRDGAQGG